MSQEILSGLAIFSIESSQVCNLDLQAKHLYPKYGNTTNEDFRTAGESLKLEFNWIEITMNIPARLCRLLAI